MPVRKTCFPVLARLGIAGALLASTAIALPAWAEDEGAIPAETVSLTPVAGQAVGEGVGAEAASSPARLIEAGSADEVVTGTVTTAKVIRAGQDAAPAQDAIEAPLVRTATEAAEPATRESLERPAEVSIHAKDMYTEALGRGLAQLAQVDQADYRILLAFYEGRDGKPVWWHDGAPTPAARSLAERISNARLDGLNPDDYILPEMEQAEGERAPVVAAIRELTLAKAALNHMRHIARGRVKPSSLSSSIHIEPEPFDALAALESLAEARADEVNRVIDAIAPTHPDYLALRNALAPLLEEEADKLAHAPIPDGRILRPGMADERVPLLRQRLGLDAPDAPSNRYDEPLVAAVEAFQLENGLKQDGIIGPNTLLYLNADAGSRAELVALNMERWRWLPRDMGSFHVKVNIPEFTARIFRDNMEIYRTNVIVGQPKHETPIFSDEIEHVVVNPYWNVPYSIASKEMLPNIQKDPGYLVRNRYEVFYTGGGKVQQVSPAQVDWSQTSARNLPFRFRQVPGANNALGDIKFMFPNRHSVYLHDTPSRNLFSRTSRALSHGCIRVQNPFEFADVLLQNEDVLSGERLRSMRGDREKTAHLKAHVPVHLMYFTARVETEGELRVFNDIYGHDAKLRSALEQSHARPLQIAGDF